MCRASSFIEGITIIVADYVADLDSSIAAADLNNSIESLRNASTMLTMAGQTSQANTLNNTANSLVFIRDVLVVELVTQLVCVDSG